MILLKFTFGDLGKVGQRCFMAIRNVFFAVKTVHHAAQLVYTVFSLRFSLLNCAVWCNITGICMPQAVGNQPQMILFEGLQNIVSIKNHKGNKYDTNGQVR